MYDIEHFDGSHTLTSLAEDLDKEDVKSYEEITEAEAEEIIEQLLTEEEVEERRDAYAKAEEEEDD